MREPSLPNQVHMRSLWLTRKYELDIAIKHFPPVSDKTPCHVLELGAGTGQQAKYLDALGYTVSAFDLPTSNYRDARVFTIEEYDGRKIPTNDEIFDVVFSSNVLEHVVHIDEVLAETYRVLKPGGVAIHLIPSPACRVWSIPTHYIWLARRIVARISAKAKAKTAGGTYPRTPQSRKEWLGTLFPLRHGERGNTLTEVYFFSKRYWTLKFKSSKFAAIKTTSNGIFYTMANATGASLPLKYRKTLSTFLGSSCHIYIIMKN